MCTPLCNVTSPSRVPVVLMCEHRMEMPDANVYPLLCLLICSRIWLQMPHLALLLKSRPKLERSCCAWRQHRHSWCEQLNIWLYQGCQIHHFGHVTLAGILRGEVTHVLVYIWLGPVMHQVGSFVASCRVALVHVKAACVCHMLQSSQNNAYYYVEQHPCVHRASQYIPKPFASCSSNS